MTEIKIEDVIPNPVALPQGWQRASLDDVAEIIMGQSPSSEYYNTEGNGLPFFQGKAEFGDLYPKAVKWCTHPNKVAQKDDVLISVRAPVGPTNLGPSECCIGRGLAAIRPKGGIPSRYVLYYLRGIEKDIEALGTGTTFKAISGKILRSIAIPLAPPNQQKQIVAEIEKQFSRLDEAVANLKRVKANLKRYKAAVLKAAVEGRLVETEAELARREGRSYETGAQLLQRILDARRSRWKGKGKYKEPAEPDWTNLPELPDGWVWASLEQACVKITDGTHHSPKNFPQGEYKYMTSKNVREFRIDLEDITYVDKATHDAIYLRCDVRKDDVLYVKDGVNTGLAAKNSLDEPFSLLSSVGVFRTVPELIPDYLVAYLNSSGVRDRMLANIAGVAITRLTLNKLKATAVAIPPPIEQHRIVTEVDYCLSLIHKLEVQVDVNLKRSERLRQLVLETAFSGRLVPEDPNAKPASELLARIRAETSLIKTDETLQRHGAETTGKETIMMDLIKALRNAGGWISAQEVFRRCGVSKGADTDTIERMYAELRDHIKPGVIQVERRGEEDWLRLAETRED